MANTRGTHSLLPSLIGGGRYRAVLTEWDLAKEPESQSERVSPQKPPRRPITIDLPAEEIARKAAAEGAPAAPAPDSPAATPVAGETEAKAPDAARAPKKDTAGATGERTSQAEAEIPSAFATRKANASAPPPPKWRPVAEPPPPRPFAPFLIASLAGGAVVALAVVALAVSGVFERGGDAETPTEIAALKGEIAKLQQAKSDDGLAALGQQVSLLENTVAALSARPQPATSDAALGDLLNRVAALEQSGASLGTAELEKRVTELADAVATLKSAQPADGASVESALQPLSQQVQELSTRLQEVASAVEKASTEDRVTALEAKLDEVASRIELASALAPAVAADALAAALDSGRPFSNELAAVKSFGIGEADAEALAPQAATGLPTLAQLRATFEAAMESAELATPIPAETGTFDRLIQSARGLVEVRPVRPTAGTDPAAMVARIRGALAAGDLRTALAEWEALPDTIKAATTDWQKQAEMRLKADDLAASVRTSALSRLGAGE